MGEVLVAVLLVVAGVFGLVGSVGLVKLPDTMTRLHAPTKATTLGVGGVLLASMLAVWLAEGRLSWHELVVTLFLFMTAPVTALFIARARMHGSRMQDRIPPPDPAQGWSVFTPDPPQE